MPSPAVSMMRPPLGDLRKHDRLMSFEVAHRARVIGAHQCAITSDVCGQNGCEPARLALGHAVSGSRASLPRGRKEATIPSPSACGERKGTEERTLLRMSSVSEMGSFTSFEDARDWSALPPTAAVMVRRREGSKRAITGHRPPFIRLPRRRRVVSWPEESQLTHGRRACEHRIRFSLVAGA